MKRNAVSDERRPDHGADGGHQLHVSGAGRAKQMAWHHHGESEHETGERAAHTVQSADAGAPRVPGRSTAIVAVSSVRNPSGADVDDRGHERAGGQGRGRPG